MLLPMLLLNLSLWATPQQADETALEGCRRCDHRGVVDCKSHKGELFELEQQIDFCSVAAACPDCAGALLVPCSRCDGGPETAIMVKRRAEVAKWAQKPHHLEIYLERELTHMETQHLVLVSDVEKLRDGKKKITGHILLHRVARDGEQSAQLLDRHFSVSKKYYRSRMMLWFWNDQKSHQKVMEHFLGSGSAGDFKWLGKNPRFSVNCDDNNFQLQAPGLHSLGVHNAIHMLISNMHSEIWIGDMGGGWFDSGAAHWYEEKIFNRVGNYCIDELTFEADYAKGLWRAALRKYLDAPIDAAILPQLLRQQTGAMMPRDHALAWSFWDWLVSNHPTTLSPILKGLKKREAERDLFKLHLKMNLRQAEDAWRKWVHETYPRKEPKRRK